jgi:hypothetical protein
MSIPGYHWTDLSPLKGKSPDNKDVTLPRAHLFNDKTGDYKAYVAGKVDGSFEVIVGRPGVSIGNVCTSIEECKTFAEETLLQWKLV